MTRSEIKEVVEEAIDDKLKEFWVDRELHYKHHAFIDKWMQWSDDATKTIRHTILKAIVLFFLGLLVVGFFIRYQK